MSKNKDLTATSEEEELEERYSEKFPDYPEAPDYEDPEHADLIEFGL